MVSVYFDDNLVENPVEWESLSVAITFDHTNQITEIEYDTQLTFFKSGFEYLYAKRLTSCELVNVRVEMTCSDGKTDDIINGNIFVTDCVFNELECSVQTIIQDDGYSSRIQNNKSTKVSLGISETKNGEALTAPSERLVFMFTPSTGNYQDVVRGYTVYEAFKFLVSWMSDNTVEFVSDYFETGDGKGDWICSGVDLRNRALPTDIERINPPTVSFDGLYSLMRKLTNVAIGFQRQSNGTPVLRIEPLSFFRNSSVILNLNDVNKTELSFVKELLYARIKIGSQIIRPADCDSGNAICSAANNISYYGFDTEEYSITGECNEDIELDLSVESDFVVDTNTIEDVIVYDNDSFDDSVFLINTFENSPSAYRAVQTDVFNIGAYWYNERYTNKEVLLRYVDYLTGNLLLFSLYNGLNLFRAIGTSTVGVLLTQQTPSYQTYSPSLSTIVYDPFNRFNISPTRFTPVDEGAYQFSVGVLIDDFPTSDVGVTVYIFLNVEHYDSSNTLINKYSSDVRSHVTVLANPEFEEWTSPYIPMDSGDYCTFTVDYAQLNVVTPTSQARIVIGGGTGSDSQYFECINSRVVIQDIQANTGQDRRISKTSFNYPIAWGDFKQYLNDTTKLIGVSNQRINRTGWNNEIRYNFINGETELSILSNDA